MNELARGEGLAITESRKALALRIKAITKIHTGGVKGKRERILETGIMGSLRWWSEAIVRGLCYYACDPTSDSGREYDQQHGLKSICPVCQLYGCTGWARKFRLVLPDQLGAGETAEAKIYPLRALNDHELALLGWTFRIITEYGSLGGKMADIKDGCGLVQLCCDECRAGPIPLLRGSHRKARNDKKWPNLAYFFFVPKAESRLHIDLKDSCRFLKGTKGISKRYFHKEGGGSHRVFGYAIDDTEFEEISEFSNKQKMPPSKDKKLDFVLGPDIIKEIKGGS